MPEGVQGTPWVQYSKQTTSGSFQIRSDCSSTRGMEVQQVLEVAGAGCGMVRRFNRTQTERNEKKISAQSYSHTVTQSDSQPRWTNIRRSDIRYNRPPFKSLSPWVYTGTYRGWETIQAKDRHSVKGSHDESKKFQNNQKFKAHIFQLSAAISVEFWRSSGFRRSFNLEF